MRCLFPTILFAFLVSCTGSSHQKTDDSQRLELVPEPDKEIRLEQEKIANSKKLNCVLENPDESLNGITFVDSESFLKIIGDAKMANDFGEYKFYSNMENQTLTMTQHPGDSKYEISIFKVKYSSKANQGYQVLETDDFESEKGIKLGISKSQVIEKLGTCYLPIDSSANHIKLYYRIDLPKDSRNKILETHNMPTYYASYVFRNDTLIKFEFGFEYP
ncbi:MAG: hypothetical protein EOO51_13210 [Flavobacterium sp.]|nr:MAG: hypothetical protein EOO51_13210 [Flavobacterium sp.]